MSHLFLYPSHLVSNLPAKSSKAKVSRGTCKTQEILGPSAWPGVMQLAACPYVCGEWGQVTLSVPCSLGEGALGW